ncbi:MAG: tRNA (guanosine(37)-N1)-methyltransferase TrmD [Ruminococcaceae bacterium]|nr:tRNA (guanosine(37)-N1)-methyltransferase TrmD [Oscillospiraceae bacterium]
MIFDIMTLFPELVDYVLGESILGRAQKSGAIEIECHNIRDYTQDKHRRVDDTPYGGGKGMLMMAPPIYNCYEAILKKRENVSGERKVIYMSPAGKILTQEKAEVLSHCEHIVILCGHYEGVDRRIIDEIVDEEISIGDFVLTGGEIPACILVDSVARLVDGVLAAPECYLDESITGGLLEYPQYTRPYEFHGVTVPDVLISGHHENIDKWRKERSIELTKERRPDLLEKYERR